MAHHKNHGPFGSLRTLARSSASSTVFRAEPPLILRNDGRWQGSNGGWQASDGDRTDAPHTNHRLPSDLTTGQKAYSQLTASAGVRAHT